MNADPNIVNRKNFRLAYTRRVEPQTPMIRNIGTSSASKNTKNSRRSSAQNDPSTTVSRSSESPMNRRTRCSIPTRPISPTGNMNAVRRTSQMLNPSTPTR